jgi:hypothetical protein
MNYWRARVRHYSTSLAYGSIWSGRFTSRRRLGAKPSMRSSHTIRQSLHLTRSRDPKTEEKEFEQLKRGLVLGFFLGGYILNQRTPEAYAINFDPLTSKPSPMPFYGWNFAGIPNMIKRLFFGCDDELKRDIITSGKWGGSVSDFDTILAQHHLVTAALPIREAVDFVHAGIYSTIKAMKFSSLAQACGGPIEIAVITTDRRFRWVRHKEWDSAITEGEV